MQQEQSLVLEPAVRQLHELAVVLVPDVLAQADGDDAIETAGFAGGLAIVLVFEPHRQSLAEIPAEGHLFREML